MEITQVKTATHKLVSAMTRLIPQLSADVNPPSFADLQEIITADNHFLFVAEENGEILGTLTMIIYRIPTGQKAWIEDVVVDVLARGKGVGRRLTEHAVNLATSLGIEKIDLTSSPSRVAANELYKKNGFTLRETNVYRYQKAENPFYGKR